MEKKEASEIKKDLRQLVNENTNSVLYKTIPDYRLLVEKIHTFAEFIEDNYKLSNK